MKRGNYDIIFVQGNLTPIRTHITGGEFIVNSIANDLSKDHKVAIAYMKDWRNSSIKGIFKTLLHSKPIAETIRKLNNVENNLSKSVDTFIIKNEKGIPDTKIIIANFATTVDIADKYVSEHKGAKGFHFIQNELDFKDSNNLHKIAINKKDAKRFKAEAIVKIGIEGKWFASDKKENMILFPLRPEEYKGAKYMLEASRLIHERFPNYKQIAFGWYNEPIPEYIEFKKNIDTNSLIRLFAKAKLFILPSLVEGFSLTNLQAMANGCVVITTDCGGINEYSNNENSIIIPTKNPIAIADAVYKLITNNEFLFKIAKNGKETAKQYKIENTFASFRKAIGASK